MSRLNLPVLRKKVYREAIFPLLGISCIGLAVLFVQTRIGYSVLLGGIIWFIPAFYAAFALFHRMETEPKRAVTTFYRTEIVKLLLIALLFILVMKWVPVSLLSVFSGYLGAQVLCWIFQIKGM